ncbi:uncharacterized protein LAESUDRAFT_809026 [Laetiporus sulphureus 93-53]|uniref:Uncharacterized protein n=1 Tax=Laetiporus sulphureus 93-53 TaxID=1314785 RepID=A0A165HTZ6_9APHY|nr:uncharacterized protein LAESUDRAFT_809026 [Laetiporus sulphureus 93-53]KZT12184.1 hypothetical protein LAESUDRAFT_809026 [Laetiporus sulphureus 93-53]
MEMVLSRAEASSMPPPASSRLAMSTITGMVIGALCLFLLVITYQLIPRLHHKVPARNSIGVLPAPKARAGHRLSLFGRIGALFSRLILLFISGSKTGATTAPASERHKSFHSFHLSSQQRRDGKSTGETFSTRLRLKLHILPATDLLSPRPLGDHKHYRKLDDNKDCYTQMPKKAVMSPWSPREQDFPYSSVPTPSSLSKAPWGFDEPPPFSPPPAYVPGTPIRYALSPTSSAVPSPLRDGTDHREIRESMHEAIDLSEVVVVEPSRPEGQTPAGAFVISDDMDSFSDTSSISSVWSSCTFEEIV